jgi:hypothetical protein
MWEGADRISISHAGQPTKQQPAGGMTRCWWHGLTERRENSLPEWNEAAQISQAGFFMQNRAAAKSL